VTFSGAGAEAVERAVRRCGRNAPSAAAHCTGNSE